MQIRQIKLRTMLVFCYAVADEESRTCALIDPAFEVERILAEIDREDYRVTHIINTHGHSDHTAGNAEIKRATGARIYIHELDARRLTNLVNRGMSILLGGLPSPGPDVLLKHGDLIEIGASSLRVIHTPGHTPGSICLYTRGHLFTGDTLFVGGVGRSDLPGGSTEMLVRSIRERIYSLPPRTVVWPGHDYGSNPNSTVEREMRTDPFSYR